MAANATTIEEDIPIGETDHLYIGTIVPSTSYPTNGEVIDASANSRFKKLQTGAAGGYVTSFDPATQKLKIFRQKDPGNAGGADIALVEVTNGVDLSGVTFGFIAVGA